MSTHASTLKILYWNACNIKQRTTELPTLLSNIDIFVCVESWLTTTDGFDISGFKVVRKDRLHARGGEILYSIRNNIAYRELSNITLNTQHFEVHGIRIENINPTLDIIVCYRVPKQGK